MNFETFGINYEHEVICIICADALANLRSGGILNLGIRALDFDN
jgi:hypothetical protein